jgi:TRAP transporter TAXI family solute receptor
MLIDVVKLEFNKILLIAIGAVSLGLIAALAAILAQNFKTQRLTLAAGSTSGESYILGNALKTVVERHYPRIRIALQETGGTVESLHMLEDGRAQLAAAQADLLPGPAARILAILYDDTFQLLVLKDSPFRSFADLRGQRIALSQSGGQFQSFLWVAEHFGLRAGDFRFVGANLYNAVFSRHCHANVIASTRPPPMHSQTGRPTRSFGCVHSATHPF